MRRSAWTNRAKNEIRTRHLAFFVALAERARPELVGPEQRQWLARLGLEWENLLAAHAWCDRAEQGAESGVRLVYAVKPYWFNRGLLSLGHRLTVEALEREGAQGRNLARCRVLADAGQYCSFMGRYREAQAHLAESLAIAREIEDTRMIARVLQPLGMASLGQGDVAAARGYLQEALALARKLGDKRELAGAINALAQLHRIQGDLEAAEPLYDQVVALARELGDREIIAVGLLNLAMASLGRGANDRARTVLLEALAIAEEIGSRPAGQSVVEVGAGLAALRQEWSGPHASTASQKRKSRTREFSVTRPTRRFSDPLSRSRARRWGRRSSPPPRTPAGRFHTMTLLRKRASGSRIAAASY